MTIEAQLIARLRRIASDPAARGLLDDAALLDGLVITHDTIAEGVHFLPSDPAASVGWKLVAVNLSDLAAKGASPAGALLSLTIGADTAWDDEFLTGVEHACESYALPLIGGDTIALPPGATRVLGLTAIGRAGTNVPSRSGARPGDTLWVVGSLGDAAAGLRQLIADSKAHGLLVESYRRPVPQLGAGQVLSEHATAMMDISDGLLLDASRLAEASDCGADIALDLLPLSRAFVAEVGHDLASRLFAATGGDDYALLAALPAECNPLILPLPSGTTMTRIGTMTAGSPDVRLFDGVVPIPLPETLGYEHRGRIASPVADRP
ncbi:thiamine-phosphate kinase [Sphingomonas hankyongi]|uniref:Thiamine-monophosphate kinase n=1 Tax=Sphingomonas hankyongi TaxID=2908209 RepID=A0ABT0S378_9SPHN|nr:thiamine-phosphate kinase [Sphingomonas hankyongi]